MYRNRVVLRRELSASADCADALRAAGLQFDPEIDEMVSQLDEYLACSPIIFHHTRPMMDFVGPDLSVYMRIVDISEIDQIVAEIHAYWRDNKLQHRDEVEPTGRLGHFQTGGPIMGLSDLSPESFERLLNYYIRDYQNIPSVSAQNIQQEYAKTRASILRGAP